MPRIPPPFIAIVFALLIWLLAHYAPLTRFWFPAKTLVALGVAGMGAALDVWAALCFRAARTTVNPVAIEKASALVTSGPFMFSRNPMYVGLVLILTGVALYDGGASGFLVLPVFILVITAVQIKPEERMMRAKFGDDYAAYCARVRRWI